MLFHATNLITEAFDRHGIKYHVDEWENVSTVLASFAIRMGPQTDVRFISKDDDNDVAIRGLADGTVVRITDLRGSIVHETMSNGGGAMWNLCNPDGRRVETGIYLIQCTTTDGVTRNVGKIHVVK